MPELLKGPVMSAAGMTLVTLCHPTLPIQPFVRIRLRFTGHESLSTSLDCIHRTCSRCLIPIVEIAGKVSEENIFAQSHLKAEGWTVEPAPSQINYQRNLNCSRHLKPSSVARVHELMPVWNILEGVTAHSSGL